MAEAQTAPKSFGLKDLLFTPVGCLLTISPYALIGLVVVLLFAGSFAYYNLNIDLFGLGAPDYAKLVFDRKYQHVQGEERSWTLLYESTRNSGYIGKVRHASPIRLTSMPFLTHDILVTSGDFADPNIVVTSVRNHRFKWVTKTQNPPEGKINLLHAVPMNEEIYRQLLQVQPENQVTITGLEIDKIEEYDMNGMRLSWWQDSGCNTLLVTSVTIESSK